MITNESRNNHLMLQLVVELRAKIELFWFIEIYAKPNDDGVVVLKFGSSIELLVEMSHLSQVDLYPSNLKRRCEALEKKVLKSSFVDRFSSVLSNPFKKFRMSAPSPAEFELDKMFGRDDFLLNPNYKEDLESWKEIAVALSVPSDPSEYDKMVIRNCG